jgi:hypothetical protein
MNPKPQHHEPAAAFANEHLNSLDNGLFERLVGCPVTSMVGNATIPYTLHVLVFGEESIADAGQQHHADEEGDNGFGRHGCDASGERLKVTEKNNNTSTTRPNYILLPFVITVRLDGEYWTRRQWMK